MEANRMGIDASPKVIPRLNLDNETFQFVKKLNVGDKGNMSFNGIIKSHSGKENDDDEESKVIRFTSIDLNSTRPARLI